MPTIRDLVKKCPGCGSTVVYPFTQDFDINRIRLSDGSRATPEEFGILKSLMPMLHSAREIGVRIRTIISGNGDLWHEPCYILNGVRDGAYGVDSKRAIRIVTILTQWVILLSCGMYDVEFLAKYHPRAGMLSTTCSVIAAGKTKCCISCHEDEEDYNIPLCTLEIAGFEYEVCCKVATAYKEKRS